MIGVAMMKSKAAIFITISSPGASDALADE
jgi:hypothetical protein